jgi:hypothetical protein
MTVVTLSRDAVTAQAFAGPSWRKRPKHFASCRVHKMDKGTGGAGDRFVLITFARLRDLVGELALARRCSGPDPRADRLRRVLAIHAVQAGKGELLASCSDAGATTTPLNLI